MSDFTFTARSGDWLRRRMFSDSYHALRPSLADLSACSDIATGPSREKPKCADRFLERAKRLLAEEISPGRAQATPLPQRVYPTLHGAMYGDISIDRLSHFRCTAKVKRSAFLAGSFNNWGVPVPLAPVSGPKDKSVIEAWECWLCLQPGIYHYKYVVDGSWVVDKSRRTVTVSEFGTVNELKVEGNG